MIIDIQACARGYIGRKIYERFCQRQQASLIIQHAIRVYIAVKDNPWFKLMKKVRAPEFQLLHQREKIERELKERIQKIVDELEQVSQAKKLLNQTVDNLNLAIENDQLDLQNKREQYSKLQDTISEVYADCKLIDKEIEGKNSELSNQERELKGHRETTISLQQEAKMLEQKISEINADCLKITEMINLTRSETLRTQTKVDEQKDAVKAQQFSRQNISNQLESQRETVRQKIEQKTIIIREKIDTDNNFHYTFQTKKRTRNCQFPNRKIHRSHIP
jgi:myosin heavy subunit